MSFETSQPPSTRPLGYYSRFRRQFVADIKAKYWDGILALVAALLVAFGQYKTGLVPQGKGFVTFLWSVVPPLMPLACHSFYHLVRTPRILDDLQVRSSEELKKTIESSNQKTAQLVRALEEDQRVILFERGQKEIAQSICEDLKERLFPLELAAERDRRNIEKMIHTWNPAIRPDLISPTPSIEFECFVFNGSMFPVTIGEAIEGFMSYENRRLKGSLSRKAIWRLEMKRGETCKLKFQLWLWADEAEELKTKISHARLGAAQSAVGFRFQDVRILITGDGLEPRRLVFNFGG